MNMHHNIKRKFSNQLAWVFNTSLDGMVKLTNLAIAIFL